MSLQGIYELLSWMSPSYPVGAYTYSHAIEYAVEEGYVKDLATLTSWLEDVVEFGSARNDAILLAETYRALQSGDSQALRKVAEVAFANRPTRELELETTAQGKAFVTITEDAFPSSTFQTLKSVWDGPIVYPVAVATAAAGKSIPLETALTGYLHAFISNLVSAAVRIVPLGQTDGQRAIAALEEICAEQVQRSLFSNLDDLGSATLMVDWCSCKHETQYTRLFRS